MSTLRSAVITILVLVIAVVLAIFAVENLGSVSATFVGVSFTLPLWWVAIGSAILGFIMAALLTLPGRLSTGWRARSLAREHERKDSAMEDLRREHDRLRAENTSLRAERDQLQARLDESMRPAPERPFVEARTAEPSMRPDYPAAYDDRIPPERDGYDMPPRGDGRSLPYRDEPSAAPPRR